MHKLYVNSPYPHRDQVDTTWSWPVDPSKHDRFSGLRTDEKSALAYLVARQRHCGHFPPWVEKSLYRLTMPIDEVMTAIRAPQQPRGGALTVLILEMHQRQTSFWEWTRAEWLEIFCSSRKAFQKRYPTVMTFSRPILVAAMYLLQLFDGFRDLGIIDRTALASRIFGRARVESSIKRVVDLISSWGYTRRGSDVQWAVCTALLANKSPILEHLTTDLLEAERKLTKVHNRREGIGVLSRALAGLGIMPRPLSKYYRTRTMGDPRRGVAAEWVRWVERWRDTSTLQPQSKETQFVYLLKAGRWLTAVHPDCTSPDQWTRDLAAEWVGVVCRMKIGEWTQIDKRCLKRFGAPLSPKSKVHQLTALGSFFRDIQEWEWIPRRFDPRRCFAAPRSLRALITPKPRVIASDVWAKLLWAGLNLEQSDLPTSHCCPVHYYPLAMVRALTMVWLFGGLRVDEIVRLRVGCTQKQWSPSPDSEEPVCNLDVPVNKTSDAFNKPVDQIVGEAVKAWEAERPVQPTGLDEKTGEEVNFLFMFRGNRVPRGYVNKALINILCRKAGVPRSDARGKITSHRARSTIASQLFNAKEPMSLFELQKWLGHKWANSTQYYLDISPTKLANSYRRSGYFARNLRAIEVLIDRDVIANGKAAQELWKFYDLGHGYCTYDFFDQCPHRMACAKCAFYLPKGSTKAHLLEGKKNLLRLRQEIPLNETELEAVDEGVGALEKLLSQLADVPTPAGPTPRQLQSPALVTLEASPVPALNQESPRNDAQLG